MVGRTALSSVAIVNGILRETIVLSTARTCTGVTMTILVIQKRPFTEKKRLTLRLTFKQKIKGEIQYKLVSFVGETWSLPVLSAIGVGTGLTLLLTAAIRTYSTGVVRGTVVTPVTGAVTRVSEAVLVVGKTPTSSTVEIVPKIYMQVST